MPGTSRARSAPPSRPPTALTAATMPAADDAGSWVLAILVGRSSREVGVAALETESGKVTLTQFVDSSTFVKTIHLARNKPPNAILVSQSALSKPPTGNAHDDEGVSGAASSEAAMLVRGLEAEFPTTPVVGVLRKYWNEQAGSHCFSLMLLAGLLTLARVAGYEFLSQLTVHDDERVATLTTCRNKWYALSASSALFKWLETAQSLVFPPKSLRIRYTPVEGTCLIDSESAKNLELVANLLNKNSKQHLLGMLNKCFTPMGTRHLRSNILSPLTSAEVIDARLDAVEELVNSEERARAVRKALEPLKSVDLDKIIARLLSPTRPSPSSSSTTTRTTLFPRVTSSQDPSIRISQNLAYLLSLRTFLSTLASMRSSVEHADALLLRQVERVLEDPALDRIAQVMECNVNRDVWAGADAKKGRKGSAGAGGMVSRHARLFAIKAERKLLLDVARETYRENLSDVHDLGDALRERFSLESFDAHQLAGASGGGAFVFSTTKDEWEEKRAEMAREVTNVVPKGKKVEFSTLELKKRNARLLESTQEILVMSEEVLEGMFDEIRADISCLYKCAEAIALLDMLSAFADVSSKHDCVRPEWTDTLAIKSGRHPLHEQFRMSDGAFVPNDTYASDSASFQLIFGPNMSGKSTLLRQIALLHIMAQIGCFVPAHYASFRPVSALLTRLSNDDYLEANLSTFASEMTTMSMILSALGAHEARNCLVLVDELGRGTSPVEGVGIAHAVAEEIIKSKAFCFFATHFKGLALTLPSRYPNVVSLHLETELDESQPDFSLTFRHRLRDGATPLTHYGLELAKVAKLPPALLRTAQVASLTLESLAEDGRQRSAQSKLARRRRALLELKTSLKDLAQSRVTDATVLQGMLKQLQDDTMQMLAETMDAVAAPSKTGGVKRAREESLEPPVEENASVDEEVERRSLDDMQQDAGGDGTEEEDEVMLAFD
ncbi:MutS family protein MSH4 [Rhodotorula paludigena]|uniref:MutS family protein MSH4 n=1 Tax=Rhodotorula paludigena TaxID=86838 RepID=UPI0031702854